MTEANRAPRPDGAARRLLREPLLHFVVLAAAMFAVHAAVTDDSGAAGRDAEQIVISPSFVEGLRSEHVRRTGKPPDAEQQRALLEQWVRREALYREARALGLGRGDPIVRRRLVQKMELALEASAELDDPTDAELEAHLREHADRFERPARVAFAHVYFDRDRHDDAGAAARAALARLRQGDVPPEEARREGDGFALSNDFGLTPVERVRRTFGPGFAEALAGLEPGRWEGPVDSSYGLHLVRVEERQQARLPELSEIRERVRRDWLSAEREAALERAIDEVVDRYEVVRKDDAPRVAEATP